MPVPTVLSGRAPRVAARPLLIALLLGSVLVLGACKRGEGDAQAKGKDGEDKGPEAVPVEVVAASRRAIAASYTGTAPLEALSLIHI